MTDKNKRGLFLRALGLLFALSFIGFGACCLWVFWEQEAVAKEIYSWEPVVTTDYEIRKVKEFAWPFEGFLKRPEGPAEPGQEFNSRRERGAAAGLSELSISISYRYQYHGYAGESNMLSPFYELNAQALRDPQLHRYLLREDRPPLTVYVDPDQPARSALVRGWAQDDRWGALLIGGVLLPLSLVIFYLLVRPADRVEELFKA